MINKMLENPFPQENRYFRVSKIYDNYLECILLDEYTTKADGVILRGDEGESPIIYVVKYRGNRVEDSMCRLDWDTKTFKSGASNTDTLYTYVDEFSRTAGGNTEFVSPAYLNSKIRCRFNPCGTGIVKTGFGLIYWEEVHPRLWAGGSSSSYSGPFQVAKLTDTSIEVLGYNVTDSQYWNNYIIAGLSRIEVADGASVAVTASGCVYVGITYTTTYVATLARAATLPAQDATHIYVPLAYVLVTDSKISSITQIQYGIIHYPARAG